MGRKLKYKTPDEKHKAQLKWQMEHYERNKEKLRKMARERYRIKRKKEIEKQNRADLYGEN
ncbi:MAG: hypothetical protein H8E03_00010 [Pelagibacteraceae bacterium]|nr:hypothetical protein [Pelagibacteraceae bacterium]